MDDNYWIDNTPGSVSPPSVELLKDPYNKTLIKKEGLDNIQHTLKVEIASQNKTLLV